MSLSVMAVHSIWTVAPHTILTACGNTTHADDIVSRRTKYYALSQRRHSAGIQRRGLDPGFFLSLELRGMRSAGVLLRWKKAQEKCAIRDIRSRIWPSGFSFPNPNISPYLRSAYVFPDGLASTNRQWHWSPATLQYLLFAGILFGSQLVTVRHNFFCSSVAYLECLSML